MTSRLHASLAPAALGALLLITTACSAGRAAPAPAPAPAPEPDEVWAAPVEVEAEALPAEAERDLLGSVTYDLPVVANSWVESELDFLVGERAEVIQRWLERGDFYEPYIKDVLRAHDLPTDLYHLAMIESGFVPTARSHAGAVGMWQFMPATGRAMGLRVDSKVDERMDPVRSTRAAARHLRSLHRQLGDWALAAAAYNAGSGRITRGLAGYGARDFWELAHRGDLAEETKRYVPRLYAVTVIGRDRARFGFGPPDPAEQFVYDSVHVEFATPISELARLADVPEAEIRRLNPHLLEGITPQGGYWVWVPRGTGEDVQRAWLASDFRRDRGLGTYRVRAGDNLSMLAQRSGVTMSRIRELNPSVGFDPLRIGVELKLPYAAAQALSDRPAGGSRAAVAAAPTPASGRTAEAPASAAAAPSRSAPDAAAPSDAGRASAGAAAAAGPAATAATDPERPAAEPARIHRVEAGETLWSISRAYGVTVADLEAANALDGSTIRPGQSLTIPSRPVDRAASRDVAPAAAPVAAPREHVVSAGESLWGIARRYDSSVDAIRAANELGDRPIQPGQRLVIPG